MREAEKLSGIKQQQTVAKWRGQQNQFPRIGGN
jgi:hypothetical protein